MQAITGTVGDGGANNASDAALVQAILVKTQRGAAVGRAAGPYLASYDGVAGPATAAAIRAFQVDHVTMSDPRATDGQVGPGDATWTAMLAQVPAEFSDLRVLPGGRTVYVQATAAQLAAKTAAAAGMTFTPAFRGSVNSTINRMHSQHGIAIGVCPQGDRRTFQTQYDLRTSGRNVTNAGPGESNHNFGMAADLGFQGLRWLRADGTVVENETWWLHQLDPNQRLGAEPLVFWEALRAAAIHIGAFRGPIGDRPHIQNWDDAGVSMAARLADLLTRSGTMRWTGTRGAYRCDLGLGGELIAVGSSVQIWNRQATVTLAELQRLRTAATAARRPGVPAGAATAADVTAMQQELRRQFELADANWQAWTPR